MFMVCFPKVSFEYLMNNFQNAQRDSVKEKKTALLHSSCCLQSLGLSQRQVWFLRTPILVISVRLWGKMYACFSKIAYSTFNLTHLEHFA